ncbi:DUF3253 domain-containing protein [Mycobacterium sp. E740]|uniref:DUF3253 domain-containing protein n=1 Tax=Mycobacterium sp. E740 TaxID=1834149 RepID=UPI0007FFD5A1|nr:DUF3253 domain-containing protein [Mycobacterium sp. E740]OBI76990.1 S-adenosylmethionine tRNA ribosyltransferase [Mycobacterium sp. E740]
MSSAERLRAAILALSRARGPDKTICPSDAARAVGGDGWRELMDDAREVARALARAGDVEITQKGEVLDPDAPWRGPIRIRAIREGFSSDIRRD